jgi:hypothetical protein
MVEEKERRLGDYAGAVVSRRRWSDREGEGEDLRAIELESYDGFAASVSCEKLG